MKGLFGVLTLVFLLTAFNEECQCDEYVYPIRPGTPEWDSLNSYAARMEACNIPTETLPRMSADELLKAVLKHPYIMNLVQYESIDGGISLMSSQFNGIEELLNRGDSFETILENYLKSLHDGNLDLTCLFEVFLCQDEILRNISYSQLKYLLRETYNSFKTRVNSESYLKSKSYESGGLLLSRILMELNSSGFIEQKTYNNELKEFLDSTILRNPKVLNIILIETIQYINNNGDQNDK